jgi:hypothetical protein
MGDERSLRGIIGEVLNSLNGSKQIQAVSLNFEEEKESTFDSAVEKAWNIYGGLDAFVNCYTYEGKRENKQILEIYLAHIFYIVPMQLKKFKLKLIRTAVKFT